MRNKRAKEIKRTVKAAAAEQGIQSVSPNTLRNAKKDYIKYKSKITQNPKCTVSKRQERLSKTIA